MQPSISGNTDTISSIAEQKNITGCIEQLAASRSALRPLSTYRLQFHAGFRFADAEQFLDYLSELGISHCYSSPILKARAGSTHGYDITNHNELNPEVGSEAEFRRFAGALRNRGMGLILDVVPNHMSIGSGQNPWWQDVLENGRASEYADYFDIDWEPLKPELHNKILLPILGNYYGDDLESGKIKLDFEDGRFVVRYYETLLPVDIQTIPMFFSRPADVASSMTTDPGVAELRALLEEIRALPPNWSTDRDLVERRQQEIPRLREELRSISGQHEFVRRAIELALQEINGDPGNPRSFDALHRLLEVQPYRLAFWRVSGEEINYRRFFDINDLIGIRMENPRVFADTHKLLRRLLGEKLVTGLRIDHPDGLFNPAQYFVRAQMLYAASQCCGPEPAGDLAENGIEREMQGAFGQREWNSQRAPLYLLAEKILEPGENLPREWPMDGTVGYDFANLLNGVFIDARGERPLTRIYERFLEREMRVEDVVYESKKLIMNTALASEVNVLTHMLDEISGRDRRARDYTRKILAEAIRETIACFPVYRTYIDERGNVNDRDRHYILQATACAERRNQNVPAGVFQFLRDVLLLKGNDAGEMIYGYRKQLYFALKFQQLTGPVTAKGLEDTAFYVYNRFVSLNEVGGSPEKFGVTVDEFHKANELRAADWPGAMLGTSTHDTKRSEDVRARLNLLSEIPRLWSLESMRFRRANRTKKRLLSDGRVVPDHNEEYLLYQTLVGAWPLEQLGPGNRQEFIQRIQAYMTKAIHEAKVNLSWVNQNPEYTGAMRDFIEDILTPGTLRRPNHFLRYMEAFIPPLQFFGAINAVGQALLKLTAPGVPDVYQGQELFDFSLVDPDNRRPVDFGLRQHYLRQLKQHATDPLPLCRKLLEHWNDGRMKLWTTYRALQLRRQRPELFREGNYLPVYASGSHRQHVIAFARGTAGSAVMVAAPRLSYSLMKGDLRMPIAQAWGRAELILPPELMGMELLNVLTGERIQAAPGGTILCAEVFSSFPAALLVTT